VKNGEQVHAKTITINFLKLKSNYEALSMNKLNFTYISHIFSILVLLFYNDFLQNLWHNIYDDGQYNKTTKWNFTCCITGPSMLTNSYRKARTFSGHFYSFQLLMSAIPPPIMQCWFVSRNKCFSFCLRLDNLYFYYWLSSSNLRTSVVAHWTSENFPVAPLKPSSWPLGFFFFSSLWSRIPRYYIAGP